MRKLILFISCFALFKTLHAEPTKVREWETKSGHKAEAAATEVKDGKVSLKLANGKAVQLEIAQLVAEDQKFLQEHFDLPDPSAPDDFRRDGIFWMNCRYLGEEKADHPEEAKDFENAALVWLKELEQNDSKRAYANAVVFKQYYKPTGHNAQVLDQLFVALESEPDNKRYYEGLLAIDELSDKYLAPMGASGNSAMNHHSSKVAKQAEKLQATYGDIAEIDGVLKALKRTTDSLKK